MSLETVLVAVGQEDDDRLAALAETVIDIAKPAGATVELAHVFTEDDYRSARESLRFNDPAEATPETVARRHVTLKELGERLDEAGLEFGRHGSVSDDATKSERIVDHAEDVDADLLIVGGRKRSPTGKAVFGSTAQEVMLNSPCPVTFVRAD